MAQWQLGPVNVGDFRPALFRWCVVTICSSHDDMANDMTNRSRDGRRTRNILVFRIGQLGDTLISLPTISVIRRRHPDHRLVLLTEKQPAASGYVSSWDVLGPTGWFEEVMYYTPARNLMERLSITLSLARQIRKLDPEIIYDIAPERTCRQSQRDRFFFRYIAGVRESRGGGFLLKPPKNATGELPRIEPEWKRLLRAVDAEHDNIDFRLTLPAAERHNALEMLKELGIPGGRRLVAVAPGSKMPAKIWPQERFRELGARLLKNYSDVHLLAVGGKEDTRAADSLCAEWGERAHNLAGRLSIYGSAAVLERCTIYVGNDAGAMHLAAMMGVPCVGFFSARDYPGQWEPYGTDHAILRHETECAGCMLTHCPYDNKCLGLITVDEADSAVNSLLSTGRS